MGRSDLDPARLAYSVGMRPSPELEAITRRYLAARAAANFAQVRGTYSSSEHFTAIGTAVEDWLGAEGFLEVVQEDWETLQIGTEKVRRLEAFENGETGWVAMEGERTTPTGHSFLYRLTIVFTMEEGVWKAIQTHYSVPVEDVIVQGPELTQTLTDLLGTVEPPSDGSTARTATVLFTDVVGSTALAEELGDLAWSTAIGEHFNRLAEIVREHHGTVVKTLGDGGMYVFDSVGSGLRAAAAIHESPDDLELRLGVHTGDLVAAGDDVLGATVAKAARITAAADGGQVLVSSATASLAATGEFAFGPPVTLELKGLAGTHVVHQLN